jgi:hypothetical protein
VCPKVAASQKAPFECGDGTLAFGKNFWHDGLVEQGGGTGASAVMWTQKPGYVVNQNTSFYDCNCRHTCCDVDAKHGNLSCVDGSYGLLCSRCSADYFKHKSTGNCIKCGEWVAIETALIVTSSCLAAILMLALWWHLQHHVVTSSAKGSMVATTRKRNIERPFRAAFSSLYAQKYKIKLFIGFYQVSSLLHDLYDVPYPYTYLQVMDQIDFFSVDFVRATPGPCIFGPSYTFIAKVYTTGCVVMAIYVGFAVIIWKQHADWARKSISWVPTLLFLVYPGSSALFFRALRCRTIDGSDYLAADLSVDCSSSSYQSFEVFAVTLVLLWACGLPVLTFALLWPIRDKIQKGAALEGFQQHLKDFFAAFRPSMWFFGVAEYIAKFLVIGIIPAARSDVMGAVIAMLVVNGYLALLLVFSPYAKKTDNFLAVSLNALLSIVILVSALLKMDVAYLSGHAASGFDTGTAAHLLVVSNVLVILVTCASYVVSVQRSEQSDERGMVVEAEMEVELMTEGLDTGSSSISYEQLSD